MKELTEERDIQTIKDASHTEPVFVFKHSTSCPISAGAYRRVAAYLEAAGDSAPKFFLVKVIESRALSNAITREWAVHHASPQLILVQNDRASWDTSHGAITGAAIGDALEGVRQG